MCFSDPYASMVLHGHRCLLGVHSIPSNAERPIDFIWMHKTSKVADDYQKIVDDLSLSYVELLMDKGKLIGAIQVNWETTEEQAQKVDSELYAKLKEDYNVVVHIETVWKIKNAPKCKGASPTIWTRGTRKLKLALKRTKLKIMRKTVENIPFSFAAPSIPEKPPPPPAHPHETLALKCFCVCALYFSCSSASVPRKMSSASAMCSHQKPLYRSLSFSMERKIWWESHSNNSNHIPTLIPSINSYRLVNSIKTPKKQGIFWILPIPPRNLILIKKLL